MLASKHSAKFNKMFTLSPWAATEAKGDQSAVLLAKGQPELLAAINQALRTAKQDGNYQKISHKYFGTDVSQ
jgi:cystine transport system substrate-binding protein